MKPVAMEFARTSTLFQGLERELFNDAYRWSPPKPVPITSNQPSLYDPSLTFTTQQKWAIKWNNDLMKSLQQLDDSDRSESLTGETGFMLGFCFELPTYIKLCLVGEMSTRTCHAMWLEHVVRNDAGNESWMIPTTLSFLASVDCIASLYDDAMHAAATKQYIKLSVVRLKIYPFNESSKDGRFRLQYYITDQQTCCTLKIRKRRPKTHISSNESNAINETVCNETIANHATSDDDEYDDTVDDHDSDDEAQLRSIAEELLGESEASLEEFQKSLDADMQFQDIATMEELHTRLVAAAVDKCQDDDGKSKSKTHSTDDFDSVAGDEHDHTYEDGMGESVFQRYLNNSLKTSGVGDQHEDDQGDTIITLTQSQIDAAFYIWSRNITESMDALHYMVLDLRRFETHAFDSSIGSDISLLIHASEGDSIEVVYVSWLKPHKKLEGRCISLDDDNCVMYPSHFTNQKVKFTNSIMVLSQSRVRVRKQSRESMPPEIRRLYGMFNAALDVSTELDLDDSSVDIGETRKQCIGCRSSESGGVLRRCALCLQCWHTDCADQCAPHTHGFIQSNEVATLADKDINVSELPFLFLLGFPDRTTQSDIA